MEYIKKEELIENEIYHIQDRDFWMIGLVIKGNNGDNDWSLRGDATYITSADVFKTNGCWAYKSNTRNYRLATSEEKHWLNEAIKLDKFIKFDEAMKSFIPEYVECILQQEKSDYKLGIIYKTRPPGYIGDQYAHYSCNLDRFKPSTKEAYDAQFVIKEPEFVLPELWHIIITPENYKILSTYFSNKHSQAILYTKGIMGVYKENKFGHTKGNIKGSDYDFGIEITFEQFKKYILKEEIIEEKVIELLPQFKVIETIETITKVENNEGNQFFIGDVVKSDKNAIYNIIGFKYNVDKTDILALATELPAIGISINKIEHYMEPKVEEPEFILPEKWCILRNLDNYTTINNWFKNNQIKHWLISNNSGYLHSTILSGDWIDSCNKKEGYTEITFDQFKKYVLKSEVKEESLLEKAKRLYPIGTKVNSLGGCENQIIDNNTPFMSGENNIRFTMNCLVYLNGIWADIIK